MLNELLTWTADNLPEDFEVLISVRDQEASICLLHEGTWMEVVFDDLTTEGCVVACVNHARECEDLPAVEPPAGITLNT